MLAPRMMRPTHTLWTLTGSLGAWNAATAVGVAVTPEQGMTFAALAVAVTMAPDKLEKIGKHRIFGHRGPTHRWWSLLLVAAIVGFAVSMVPFLAALAVAIVTGVVFGYAMHLYADLWTKSGAIGKHLPRGLRIRTGGPSEFVLAFLPALALCLILTYALMPAATRATVQDVARDAVAAAHQSSE